MSKKINLSPTKLKKLLEAAWWSGYNYGYSDPEPIQKYDVEQILAGVKNKDK